MDSSFPLTGQSILCVSSIDWDFVWQGHQEIMAELAKQGNRVLFIENTGVRSPSLKDLPRLTHRIQNWRRGTKGFRQERENLVVYSPILLPLPYSRLAQWINRFLLLQPLRRWMRASRFHRPILWTFLPTPLVLNLIEELDPELVVYYCIDNLAESSKGAARITASEEKLFSRADLVLVTAKKLYDRAVRFSGRVQLFPFGVHFGKFQNGSHPPPADLGNLQGPVVGYIGGIRKEIDQKLLGKVADLMPEVTFVMIGPLQTEVETLRSRPNIRFLGPRAHTELPAYLQAFHAGIIPYVLNPYTEHIYPAKLNEYLVMGLPVVSTDLTEIRHFNAEHGRLIEIAQTAEGFAAALREAIQKNSPTAKAQRIEAARQNRWEERIRQIASLVQETLQMRRIESVRWEETFRRVYRTARRRLIRTSAVLLLIYLALFYTPLLWILADPLKQVDAPEPADAIVVFAGGVGESGQPGQSHEERVSRAIELHQNGYAKHLVLSSGFTRVYEEAEVMRAIAVARGIPIESIVLEEKANSTYKQVQNVSQILQNRGWDSILLVSAPYHMRRASWVFSKQAPEIRVIHTPVESSAFYSHSRGASFAQIGGILHEILAILYYGWKGWL